MDHREVDDAELNSILGGGSVAANESLQHNAKVLWRWKTAEKTRLFGAVSRALAGVVPVSLWGKNPSAGTPEGVGHSVSTEVDVPPLPVSADGALGGVETQGHNPRARTPDETQGTIDQNQWNDA